MVILQILIEKRFYYLKLALTQVEYVTRPQIIINPLIGFQVAEGTFGIKTGSSLYFQVAQKITSQESLNAIVTFLTELSNSDIPKNITDKCN